MSRRWRWPVVAAGTVAIAAVPLMLGVLPVAGAPSSAANLLGRIRAAATDVYEGYAESTGYLSLPVSDDFSDVTTLLGGRTQLRVWWAGAGDWRVDTLTPVGEQSMRTGPTGTWLWDFEDNRATVVRGDEPGEVRMPRAADGLAPQLAARVLAQATPEQVSSLPSRRVAGRSADGLRLRPADPNSSISMVDVWADRASGIPVTVELYSAASTRPALSTTFLDFNPVRPDPAALTFSPPPGARIREGARLDLVGAISRFSDGQPPPTLLGYPRQPSLLGETGVGVYGRGVTQLAAAELPNRRASSLRQQLELAASAVKLKEGISASVGPVGLLLTDPDATGGQTWLVAGTLTPAGLARAARELAASPPGSATESPAGGPG